MKRLSKRQMRIFAIGQLGWSMLSGIISAWFVTFYLPTQNDILSGATQFIPPGLIIGGFLTVLGLITALSRVFDAVTDPLIASLSDRSKNKRGVFLSCNTPRFRCPSSRCCSFVHLLRKSAHGTSRGFRCSSCCFICS